MKKLKIVLPIVAFIIATTGAFASLSISRFTNAEYWYTPPIPDQCLPCTTDQDDCSITNAGPQCTCGTVPLAWQTGSMCTVSLKRP